MIFYALIWYLFTTEIFQKLEIFEATKRTWWGFSRLPPDNIHIITLLIHNPFCCNTSYYVSSVPGRLIVLCTYILTCLNVLRDHVLACPPNLACIRDRVLSSLCVNMPRCQHSHVPTCLWNLHVDVPCMSTCLNNCVSMYLISTASYHSGINSWQGN